jgi:predicted GNAT family acetyltransferase
MNVTVTDATDRRRYEVQVDGELAGFADYQVTADVMVLPHVEVLPRLEGRGLGGTLARAALDDARRRGLRVRPLCPFVRAWIARHPDYADLVREGNSS